MALIDQTNLSQDSVFIQRVRAAMLLAATNVQAESANTLQSVDSAAAATSVTVKNGAVFVTGDLVQFGVGLGTSETRSVTVAANVLTVTALTNAHKAGEVVQKVVYNHTNRSNYAKLVLNAPDTYDGLFAAVIAAFDSALTTGSTDTAINNDVASVWNMLSGVI